MIKNHFIIAIVDDDIRLLESMEDLLESAGYNVCCYHSAVSLLRKGMSDIDLIITDISMPEMDGFELMKIVRRISPKTPVFLITGRHEIADQRRAQEVSYLFRKPFDEKELLTAIGKVLHEHLEED
ncbi:response regulator [Citrobacter koseri]|uniref:response regulator n=1 Tax=Citrobacter koseri TaxID=545 RepID=UPI0028BDAB42|nr:response regulator [Citrobacter koseri]MDT7455212.1 response regulator [Citrobacter koseri]MDT7503218.1 response regulator [Citrobacter koseri]